MITPDSEYENWRFLVLRRFRDLPDALLSDSLLDSAAIECFLVDENTIRMDWFWSNLLGGIKLCVRAADADAASRLLLQSIPERFDVEGIGDYQQERCPACTSLEVSFRGLNRAVDYTRVLLGGPRALHRSLWQCDSCDHQWPESNERPPANFLTAASSILLLVLVVQTFLFFPIWLVQAIRFVASR